jgi:ligand-binding sensor domain-containing protein
MNQRTLLPGTRTLLGAMVFAMGLAMQGGAAEVATAPKDGSLPFPLIERFENFGEKEGMPAHKVHAVLKTSDGRLWVGTYNGLLVREADGSFHRYGLEDGLSHRMVMCLVEDPKTGDLWIGTMRGLNRLSGGKITSYLQTDSGLPNNVVYGADVWHDTVWAATAAGTGAMNLKTGAWKIYDHNNAVMHEPWCYSVKGGKDKVYIGVWGGGIIEHDPKLETFKEYRDPDGDFHYILVPDAGPINDITSWLAWEDGVLWQATYFGVSRYDGRGWKNWVQDKSPLVSNFVNFIWSHRHVGWIGTDRGLSVTDGEVWANYLVGEHGEGLLEVHRPNQPVEKKTMTTALANAFVLGIYVDDDEVWFATSNGLSHGVFAPHTKPATVADTH